jgi:hypothetical protein
MPRLKGGRRLHRLHVFLIKLLVEAPVEQIVLHCLAGVCLECIKFLSFLLLFLVVSTQGMHGSGCSGYLGPWELIGD